MVGVILMLPQFFDLYLQNHVCFFFFYFTNINECVSLSDKILIKYLDVGDLTIIKLKGETKHLHGIVGSSS